MLEKFNIWYSRQPEWLTNNVPADKALHFVAGALIAVLGYSIGYDGFTFAIIAGILKELYDFTMNSIAEQKGQPLPHTVDFSDFIWTMGGGAVVWFVMIAGSIIF